MRFIKLGLISFVVLFLLGTAMSLLLPSTVIVSRPIDLVASPDSVQAFVANLENWEQWLEHEEGADFKINHTENKITYHNTHIKVLSNQPGKIETEWQVGEGRKMTGDFNFISHSNTAVITLQWQFTQELNWYPWEKLASILSDKALGPYMERSLTNLKQIIEGDKKAQ